MNENLEVFFRDFSLTGTCQNKTFPVLFEKVYDPLLQQLKINKAEGLSIVATCKISDSIDLRHGDFITISGNGTYTIVEIHLIEDGKFTDLILEET